MKCRCVLACVLSAMACFAAPLADSKQIFTAIRSNDIAGLKKMLAAGASANIRGDRETTALMYAGAFGSVEAVKALLDAGADPNAKNAFDATALMWSVSEPEKVQLLLRHGADVNAKSKTGRTALMIAAMHSGSDPAVDPLLAAGADIHAVDESGMSFILAAASAMNGRQLRMGLEKGLDVNTKDKTGTTLLMQAASNGDVESAHLLISKGADVNAVSADSVSGQVKNGKIALGKFTPLLLAAAYGPPRIVDELLRAGAKVDSRDVRGMTPLQLAVATEYQNPEIVRLLLKAGADPSVKSPDGESAIDWAAKYALPGIVGQMPERKAAVLPAAFTTEHQPAVSARTAAERGLEALRKVSGQFIATGGCVACHAQAMTGIAMGVAKDHGFPISDAEMKEHLPLAKGRWASYGDKLLLRFDPEGGSDHLDYGMFYLEAVGYEPDWMTDAMVVNLIGQQLADGSWHNGGVARAPMEDSDITRTAMSLRAIRMFGWPGRAKDLEGRVERAHQWLRGAKPVYNEESAMQVLGLKWANDSSAAQLARKLAAQQHEDGGWSQNPYLASDAYATGQSLFALRESGMSASDPVFVKGVHFLLSSRHEDGTWHVKSRAPKFQPYFQSGFPYDHDQWISMAGTAWATMALATASGR